MTAECGVGGRAAWVDDDHLVVPAADGRLAVVRASGGVERFLTRDGRALAPAVSVRGDVACAIERDDACDIATVPLDGSQWPERISHADFAWDPAWSPDGGALVWQEWDLPNMPWHASRIMRVEGPGPGGRGEKPVVVAGDGACSQPRFSPDGARSRGCATARSSSTARRCSPANCNTSAPSPRGRPVNGRTPGRPTAPSWRGAATNRGSAVS